MDVRVVEKKALALCDVMSCELMEKSHTYDMDV
jgi:hypothetical protein